LVSLLPFLTVLVAAQVYVDPKDVDAAFADRLRTAPSTLAAAKRAPPPPVRAAGVEMLDRVPLDDVERARLVENGGVVVSSELGGGGPAFVYNQIYTHDIPMILTADAILFAWHETLDDTVAAAELDLRADVADALEEMLHAAPAVAAQAKASPVMRAAVDDAVLHVQVARALLASSTNVDAGGGDSSGGDSSGGGADDQPAFRYDADGYAINSPTR
jgi:hypothetical protein